MKQRLTESFRWGMKSVGGLAANLTLLTLWVDWGGIAPEVAIIPNFLLISCVGYLVTDRWVFREMVSASDLRGHLTRYVSMQSVMIAGKAVNYAIYIGLIWFGLDYRVAWAIGAVATFFATFSGNRWLWATDSPAL